MEKMGPFGGTALSRTLSVVLLTSFPAGPLQANCYVVARGPGTGCALVDPGMDAMEGVHAVVAEHNLTPQARAGHARSFRPHVVCPGRRA